MSCSAIQPALLGGSIGTFDDLFRRLARGGSDSRPVATEAQRALIVRRALAGQSLNGLGRSARFGGFADALLATVGELESGLLDPNDLEGELAALYAAYRGELDRLGMWDRDLLRRRAAERVAGRARRLGRRAGLRVRLRGPDRRGVGAAAGARRPQRGDRVDALRAGARCVRVAPADDGRSVRPRRRSHRGAAAGLRRGRGAGARASRAHALRRAGARGTRDRRRGALLRERG